MTTPDELIALEDSWVDSGITEQPPGSNLTIIGEMFGWNGVAWCAETQSVATKQMFGREILWTASVAAAIAAAKAGTNGMGWLPADADIAPGMLATYDFGRPRGNPAHFHIALVRDVVGDKFQTDGGNEGDAMRRQWRDRTYVQGFITLPYDSAPPTPPEEDEDMAKVSRFRYDNNDLQVYVAGPDVFPFPIATHRLGDDYIRTFGLVEVAPPVWAKTEQNTDGDDGPNGSQTRTVWLVDPDKPPFGL